MRRLAALAAVSTILLSGCGAEPGYDAAAVESYLNSSQASRFAGAGPVGSARCPDERALREGMTVRCTLEVSRSQVPFVVTLRDVRTDEVKVSVRPDGVIISGKRLTDVVRLKLPADARQADVECDGNSAFVVAQVGQTIDCDVLLGSQRTAFRLTVTDAAGRVSISP